MSARSRRGLDALLGALLFTTAWSACHDRLETRLVDDGDEHRAVDAGRTLSATVDGDLEDHEAGRDSAPIDAESSDSEGIVGHADGFDAADSGTTSVFPPIAPYRTGRLKVSEIHELYYELVGNPRGTPVIVLHGGPGGRAGPYSRRFYDPRRFKVLLFDQRGAGRSRPRAEFRDNRTQLLIADINSLREHLGFEGKAILSGGSWGSTLAVAYAEAHPERVSGLVIRGVFLCSKAEIDHFYHGGTAPFFPDNFARLQALLPSPERLSYPEQLFEMIVKGDRAARRRAIDGWARYEIRMVSVAMTDERARQIVARSDMTAFSTLENHYMMHGCFLDEGQLLGEAHKIAAIPTSIVNGRYDVICPPKTALDLARRLKRVKVEIVSGAAHSSRDAPLAEAFLRGIDWVADQAGQKTQ